MPPPANNADVMEAIHRCLSPDPSQRPSAKQVNMVLNGKLKLPPVGTPPPVIDKPEPTPGPIDDERPPEPPPAPEPPPEPPPAPPAEPEPPPEPEVRRIELVGESGHRIGIGVRTEVGKHLCKPFGDDARFFDTLQFVLDRGADGEWAVEPNRDATNETMLNGKAITERAPLSDGDILAVGREAKGITKLPLTVRIS
jgi:hypothetical protein